MDQDTVRGRTRGSSQFLIQGRIHVTRRPAVTVVPVSSLLPLAPSVTPFQFLSCKSTAPFSHVSPPTLPSCPFILRRGDVTRLSLSCHWLPDPVLLSNQDHVRSSGSSIRARNRETQTGKGATFPRTCIERGCESVEEGHECHAPQSTRKIPHSAGRECRHWKPSGKSDRRHHEHHPIQGMLRHRSVICIHVILPHGLLVSQMFQNQSPSFGLSLEAMV